MDVGSPVMDAVAADLLSGMNAIGWVADARGRLRWVSPGCAEILGARAEDLIGRPVVEVVPAAEPETGDLDAASAGRLALKHNRPVEMSFSIEIQGRPRHIQGTVFALPSHTGERLVGAMFADTTELLQTRRQVEDTLSLYKNLFERAGVALSVLDGRGRIQEANADFRALTGRPADALVQQPFWILFEDPFRRTLQETFAALSAGGNRLSCDAVLPRVGWSVMRCRVTVARVPSREGLTAAALLSVTAPRKVAAPVVRSLRPVERAVLCQVAAGATTVEVADAIHLSRQGVDYNLRTLMQRFGARNRAELIARAYSTGVLAPHTWPPRVFGDPDPAGNADPRAAENGET